MILLEEIIERNMQQLFLKYDIVSASPYRVMRNADLTIDEDEAADLLKEIQKQLKKRQWGEAIRLEVEEKIDKRLLKILSKELDIKEQALYKINGPLDLTFLMKMYGMEGFDSLKIPKHVPAPVKELPVDCNIFDEIRKGDILLHHPVPDLRSGGEVREGRSQRSEGTGHQADPVPCQRQFPDYRGPGPGGGEWQAGLRTGGAESPLR